MANFPKTPHHSPAITDSSPLTVPSDMGEDPFSSTGPAGPARSFDLKTPLKSLPTTLPLMGHHVVVDGCGTTPAEKTALRTGAMIQALENDRDTELLRHRLKTTEALLVEARAARRKAETEADHERDARVQVEDLLHEANENYSTLKKEFTKVEEEHAASKQAKVTLELTADKLRALLRGSRDEMSNITTRLSKTEAKLERSKQQYFEQSQARNSAERGFANERRLREELEASLRPANSDEEDAEASRESNYPSLIAANNRRRAEPENMEVDSEDESTSSPGWMFDPVPWVANSSSIKFKGSPTSVSAPIHGVTKDKGSDNNPFIVDKSSQKGKAKPDSNLFASTSKRIGGGDNVRSSKQRMHLQASSSKKTARFASPRAVTSALPPLFPPRSDGVIDLSNLPATDEENSSFEVRSSTPNLKRNQTTAAITPQSRAGQRPRRRVDAIPPTAVQPMSMDPGKVNIDINRLLNALSNAANSDPSVVAVPQHSLSHKTSITRISTCSNIKTVDPIKVAPSSLSATTYSNAPAPPFLPLDAHNSTASSYAAPPVVTTATAEAIPQPSGSRSTTFNQLDEELEALVDQSDPDWTNRAMAFIEKSTQPTQQKRSRAKGVRDLK